MLTILIKLDECKVLARLNDAIHTIFHAVSRSSRKQSSPMSVKNAVLAYKRSPNLASEKKNSWTGGNLDPYPMITQSTVQKKLENLSLLASMWDRLVEHTSAAKRRIYPNMHRIRPAQPVLYYPGSEPREFGGPEIDNIVATNVIKLAQIERYSLVISTPRHRNVTHWCWMQKVQRRKRLRFLFITTIGHLRSLLFKCSRTLNS